ncbi:MAG: YhbY family RNA-binding protein [Candidatus Thorarchaeota archaeon]
MTRKTKPDPIRLGIAWQDSAMMQIGKGGISDGLVKEAKRLLNKHKYIKVRLLRSAMTEGGSREETFQMLCSDTGAQLAGIRGNTAVLYRL